VNDAVVSVQELKMSGKAESAFEKGTKLLQKGDARGSVTYFHRALAKDPGYYRAYHNLGLAQYRLGETAKAEEALQRAIDLTNGGYAPSQFALGMILFEKKEIRGAETVIQRGLEMEPGSALGKYFLGLVQFALNKVPDAEKSAHDALFRNADQADAHILLAMIHEREHKPFAVEAEVVAYLKMEGHGPLENEANALMQRAQKEISQKAYPGSDTIRGQTTIW
jgi:tetratricopeptide (TPR) repeat protein